MTVLRTHCQLLKFSVLAHSWLAHAILNKLTHLKKLEEVLRVTTVGLGCSTEVAGLSSTQKALRV